MVTRPGFAHIEIPLKNIYPCLLMQIQVKKEIKNVIGIEDFVLSKLTQRIPFLKGSCWRHAEVVAVNGQIVSH